MDLGALTSGLLTGLREGVEAALIIAIVVSYLVRTDNARQLPKVWAGASAAALVSLVAGVLIFATVGSLREPYEQYFEAAAMLVAAAVVTWMLFWMRRQSAGIRGELHARLDRVLTAETAFGLAILAFTAVIREGIETSIFLVGQATSARAGAGGATSVLVGAVVGLVIAAAIGWVFYSGSRRINLAAFFKWTGIALVFIAAGLLSSAVHELIEVGVVRVGTQTAFDLSGVLSHEQGIGQFLRAILGYTSTPELTTLAVYVAYLAVVLALYLRPIRPSLPPARRSEAAATSEVTPG